MMSKNKKETIEKFSKVTKEYLKIQEDVMAEIKEDPKQKELFNFLKNDKGLERGRNTIKKTVESLEEKHCKE